MIKKVLFAIFAVLIVSSMATVCMGYPMYESYMTFGQDTVNFSYWMEGAVNGGAKQIVHKDTGIAFAFWRYS